MSITRFAALWICLSAVGLSADEPAADLWKKLEPFCQPPVEFAGQLGPYRSPLVFADGSRVKTPEDWVRRRAEIVKTLARSAGPLAAAGRAAGGQAAGDRGERRLHPAPRPRAGFARRQIGRWLSADPRRARAVSGSVRSVL